MPKPVLAVAAGVIIGFAGAWWGLAPRTPATASEPAGESDDARRRMEMIREIEVDVRATYPTTGRKRLDPRVMDALRRVPRHEFVPAGSRDRAYENRALAIGEGQTISQPYIVALMTDLLELGSDDVVLEVGTGSGYQAAVLAELADQVYTIEIVEPLGRAAATLLERLGYQNIETRIGDGYRGWQEHAPFDAVIVTAAADHIPPPLIEQLAPGGRMVIPVARSPMEEQLTLVVKSESGEIRTREVLPVRFVPLTGDH